MLELKKELEKIKDSFSRISEIIYQTPVLSSISINKVLKAHYVLMNVECNQKAIDEISSIFKFNDAILRNLILKKENAVTSESAMLTNKENVEKSAENYY